MLNFEHKSKGKLCLTYLFHVQNKHFIQKTLGPGSTSGQNENSRIQVPGCGCTLRMWTGLYYCLWSKHLKDPTYFLFQIFLLTAMTFWSVP